LLQIGIGNRIQPGKIAFLGFHGLDQVGQGAAKPDGIGRVGVCNQRHAAEVILDRLRQGLLPGQHQIDQATGHTGAGDFILSEDGRLARFKGEGDPVIYAGAIVLHPRIFQAITEPKFSLNRCFDTAESQGRLFGMPMRGHWLTVGTPEAIGEAEAARARYLGEAVQ